MKFGLCDLAVAISVQLGKENPAVVVACAGVWADPQYSPANKRTGKRIEGLWGETAE